MVDHPSTSSAQREAGIELVNALSNSLKVTLKEKRLKLEGGCTVEIDGYSDKPPVLCEAWVHYGKPKPSQSNKIMKDAFKLVFTEKCKGKKYKKILLFCDEEARKPLTGGSWQAQCLRDYSVKTEVFHLPKGLEKRVKAAYKKQSKARS